MADMTRVSLIPAPDQVADRSEVRRSFHAPQFRPCTLGYLVLNGRVSAPLRTGSVVNQGRNIRSPGASGQGNR